MYHVTIRAFCAQSGSSIGLGGNEKLLQQKNSSKLSEEFREGGGYNNLCSWLSWVMVPLGPWSLVRGRGGLAGNWSRRALEAP